MTSSTVAIFGEVLFDVFSDECQVLGGAPFNVAWHLSALGADPQLISAIGADAAGEQIRTHMTHWGLNTATLQLDPAHPTGTVHVELHNGEPQYTITPNCAYDFIQFPTDYAPVQWLYHGTLAVRNLVSATTLQHIKHSGVKNIFLDVNLRAPWWSLGKTIALLEEAHWVKLNRDELWELSALTLNDIAPPLETVAQHFLQQHQLTGLIVTLGSKGVLGLNQDGACIQIEPPPACTLVDTVGAGDAFSAVALFGLMQQWDFTTLLNRAQQFATHIVEQRGAISTERTWYQTMLNQWNSH